MQIPATQINASFGLLGSISRTSQFTTTSLTPVQLTGVTLTINVPAGSTVELLFTAEWFDSGTASSYCAVTIWDGVVDSGTKVGGTLMGNQPAGSPISCVARAIITGVSGSKTYNVGVDNQAFAGTSRVNATATTPMWFTAKVIG